MINNSITIDLHLYSVHEGFKLFNKKVAACYFAGASALIVITGNGQMSSEIETWAHNNQKVKKIRCTSRKGRGSWEVTLVPPTGKTQKHMPTTNILEAYKFIMRNKTTR